MSRAWFNWTFKRHPMVFFVVGVLGLMVAFGVMTFLVAAYDYHLIN